MDLLKLFKTDSKAEGLKESILHKADSKNEIINKNVMENNEKLTEDLINNLSEAQIQRIADRLKETPKGPARPPVPTIDKIAEAKVQMDLVYRQKLKQILRRLYSVSRELSPDQLAYVDSIKNNFVQNGKLASKEELLRLNRILKGVGGYSGLKA